MSGKSPGKMSRQTNRSVQTHYFKFKHQIKPPVTQYATTRPLYPASALIIGFYHKVPPKAAIVQLVLDLRACSSGILHT